MGEHGQGGPEDLGRELRRTGQDLAGGTVATVPFLIGKVRRHLEWIRREGIARVIEEDQLNPVPRIADAWTKRRWRARHGVDAGEAHPVYLTGLQRSGTNMLVRGLERAPEFGVHNENDSRAFARYRLRDRDTIAELVNCSQHAFVLFKPLCDSHRALEMLTWPGVGCSPRAVWAFRDVDGRARSTISKFGDHDRAVLRAIAHGQGDGLWQRGGLSEASMDLLASFDYDRMSAETGAALFWLVRNQLVFDLALDRRADVAIVSYNHFVADPDGMMQALCGFLGVTFRPALAGHVDRRSEGSREPLAIDPAVRERCDALAAQLDAAALTAAGA